MMPGHLVCIWYGYNPFCSAKMEETFCVLVRSRALGPGFDSTWKSNGSRTVHRVRPFPHAAQVQHEGKKVKCKTTERCCCLKS